MPIEKYKRVEDMPSPALIYGPDLADRIRALWNRARILSPPDFKRGVTRFKSIEEAAAARMERTLERMRRSATRVDLQGR